MSKLSFFFTTLIAAVPAAFLGYLCVMAFLLSSDKLPPLMMGVVGITLLACVVIVALPVSVLLKGRDARKTAGAADSDEKSEAASDAAAEDDSVVIADEAGADEGDHFIEGEADEFEGFDDEPAK